MVPVRRCIRFLLNDEAVHLDTVSATTTLLDYLRLEKRLCGTKEGCAEGDCGACTVLVGKFRDGELVYEAINACIRFVASLDGCHVVTIEHLKKPDGTLHPVQQAMVDHHGSQCGFCTPGFVMSLYAMWMRSPEPDMKVIETALQGNLCRCTGYEAIIRAAHAISQKAHPDHDPLVMERGRVFEQLSEFRDGARVEMGKENDLSILPADVEDLAEIRIAHPDSTLVAGATDVGLWVTKHMRSISPIIHIGQLEELRDISVDEETLKIGASVTYNELRPHVVRHIPQLNELFNRIGGEQVRNMGTIGGNIANGSPIGDMPPALIALGTSVNLQQGEALREVLLEDFFLDYGKQGRVPGDFLRDITIPIPREQDLFSVYKVSKRRDEDISSVCGAFRVRLEEGQVCECVIAFGGMAAIPKRAKSVEAQLMGRKWNEETIVAAFPAFGDDFQPLSDWRASAEYRLLVAKNLLRRFFLETTTSGVNTRLTREGVA